MKNDGVPPKAARDWILEGELVDKFMIYNIVCTQNGGNIFFFRVGVRHGYRNGQDRPLQHNLLCIANPQIFCRAGCPHPAMEKPCLSLQTSQTICRGRCSSSARGVGQALKIVVGR